MLPFDFLIHSTSAEMPMMTSTLSVEGSSPSIAAAGGYVEKFSWAPGSVSHCA